MEQIIKDLIKENKSDWFVKHIENHLIELQVKEKRDVGKVCCKICNKDIDEIAEERLAEIFTDLKVKMPKLFK